MLPAESLARELGRQPARRIAARRDFAGVAAEGREIVCGDAALDVNVAAAARLASIGGLEFLCGVPGTIGGALRMNAGAYGREIEDLLVSAEAAAGDDRERRARSPYRGHGRRTDRGLFACREPMGARSGGRVHRADLDVGGSGRGSWSRAHALGEVDRCRAAASRADAGLVGVDRRSVNRASTVLGI